MKQTLLSVESSTGASLDFAIVRRISLKRFLVRITGQSHFSLPLVFERGKVP